ncbi:GGDEF domain-containing protein [Erwiniaceae bacterium L1_54_6]|jgi:diguanylate cyclase (GGDEF)-like protein|nr:GGDEF domain-containing protein [Erwiniaceae bacterium L1_54_6]
MNTGIFSSNRRSLSRRLGWWAGIVIILSVLMAGIILRGTWQAASQAEQNSMVIQELYQLLNAANLLAAERAPSNILLAMAGGDQSEARNNLSRARQRTDATLRQAAPMLAGSEFSTLLDRLQDARQQVDLTAADAKPDRMRLQKTINSMFTVSDALHGIILVKTAQWFQEDTSLSTPVLRAVALTELRDTAGRMGSWLIASVQTRTPLSGSNLEGLYRADERVSMLWAILTPSGTLPTINHGSLVALRAEAREHFFKKGRPLINQLVSEGLSGTGEYSYSAAELTERYLSTLTLLERWQYEYLKQLIAEYHQRAEKESDLFTLVIFTLLIITGLILAGVFIVQIRIFRPLLTARKMIVGMAEDRDAIRHPPPHISELDQLFYSIEILKVRLKERNELTRRLQYLAETDELTGLFNRRAFDLAGESWLSQHRSDLNIFLVIMDLDYFKIINDRYGHPVGDRALISTAKVIRSHIRERDMAARIGGEEFAVIVREELISEVLTLAERIRMELHNLDLRVPDGNRINITSSFGIAGTKKDISWRQLIADADSALYEAKRGGRDCIRVSMH